MVHDDSTHAPGLLNALPEVTQDVIVKLAGFGSAGTPGVLLLQGPFADGLLITPTIARAVFDLTAAEMVDFMTETGPGTTWSPPDGSGFIDRFRQARTRR